MAKFLNHTKALFAIILIVTFSMGGALAVDFTGTDGKNTETKTIETVAPKPGVKNDEGLEKNVLKTDSLKSSNKVSEGKKAPNGSTKVKKSDNSSQSIISYNFVFYLMYKFKIADILNISKEKNAINIPSQSTMIVNGKRLAYRFLNKILD